ncbi:MAG: lamin tail domain-containing protein [Elusimicrobiota bacterium]
MKPLKTIIDTIFGRRHLNAVYKWFKSWEPRLKSGRILQLVTSSTFLVTVFLLSSVPIIYATEGVMVYFSSSTSAGPFSPSYSTSSAGGFVGGETKLSMPTPAGSEDQTSYWVAKANPVSNEAVLVTLSSDGRSYQSRYWNGSAWLPTGTTDYWRISGGTPNIQQFDFTYFENNLSSGIIVYRFANTGIPRYRTWYNASWGNEQSTDFPSETYRWIRLEPLPSDDKVICVALTNDSYLYVDVYDLSNSIWANSDYAIASALGSDDSTGMPRRFDLAIEQNSGDAMVVFVDTNNTTSLSYSTGSSSGWAAVPISVGYNITYSTRTQWVRLIAKPGSDEIQLVFNYLEDPADTVRLACVTWDGSAWGTTGSFISGNTTGGYGSGNLSQRFDVNYERGSGDCLIAFSSSNNTAPSYTTRPNGSTSWSVVSQASDWGVDLQGRWYQLVREEAPSSDEMYLMVNTSSDTVGYAVAWQKWNGASWGNITKVETNSLSDRQSFDMCILRSLVDSTPPSPISNLTAIASTTNEGQVKLEWTSPGDNGDTGDLISGSSFKLNYSSVGIVTSANFTNTTSTFANVVDISTATTALSYQTTTFFNLNLNTTYWFAIKTVDESSNWSVWKSTADDLTVNTSAYCYVSAIKPYLPSGLTQLASQGLATTLYSMQWTNSSIIISSFTQSGPVPANDLKFHLQVSSDSTFIYKFVDYTSALIPQGTTGYQWPQLTDNGTYWWRVWSEDGSGYTSSTATTLGIGGTAKLGFDNKAPAGISNLTALAGSVLGSIKLEWTSPGDNENSDYLRSGSLFRINYSSVGIVTSANFTNTSSTFATVVDISTQTSALTFQTTTFYNLNTYTTYWFAIKTCDNAGNWSVWNSSADVASVNIAASTISFENPPDAPTGFTGVALSTYSIQWSWNNVAGESGYRVRYTTSPSGNPASPSLNTDVVNWTESNLIANTSYYRVVVATNTAGESPLSNAATTYTLAAPPLPAVSTFTFVGYSSVTVNWSHNSTINPAWTRYGVIISSNPECYGVSVSTAVTFAQNLTADNTTVFNLTADSTYWFRIVAFNEDQIQTAYIQDSTMTKVGPPTAPSNLRPTAVYVSSIQWTFTDNATNETGLYVSSGDYTRLSENLGPLSGTGTTSWWEINLGTNTPCTRYAEAFNIAGSSWSVSITSSTAAAPPTNPAATTNNSSSINLTWDVNDNPAPATKYGVSYATATDFYVSTTAYNFAAGLIGNTTTVYDLSANTTYWFRVWAYNGDQIETAYITTSSATAPVPVYTPSLGDVVINEIMHDAPTALGDTNGEWIELYNNTGNDIHLSGWIINDGNNDITIPNGTTIYANSYIVAAESAALFSGAGYGYDLSGVTYFDTNSMSITDTGDTIYLSTAVGGTLISSVTFLSSWGPASNGITLEKIDLVGSDNDVNWSSCTLSTSIVDPSWGTPGKVNSVYTVTDQSKPAGISNLTALAGITESSIVLNWTAPGDDGTVGNLTGTFRINYSSVGIVTAANFTNTSSTFATVVDISTTSLAPLTACTTTFCNLTPGTSYWFALKTQDDAELWSVWNSSFDVLTVNTSAYASAQDLTPAAPSNFTALAGDTQIQLSWTANSETDLNYYKIYRDTSDPYDFADELSPGTTPYTFTTFYDTGLQNGTSHVYRMTAVDKTGHESAYSTIINTIPYAGPPFAPSNLTAYQVFTSSVVWRFQDNANNEDGLFIATGTWPSNYWVGLGSITVPVSGGTTSWWQLNLSTNTQYTVCAGATNTYGASWTSTVSTYTLAVAPTDFVATTNDSSSINLNWSANTNPDGTRYGLSRSTEPGFGNEITFINYASGLTAATTICYLLSANTTYWFRVWAYNGAGIPTNYYSDVNSSSTTAPPPAAANLLINEIAPAVTGGYDWVEICVTAGGNYSGYRFFEGSTLRKAFPGSFNPATGDYIVIWFSSSTADEDDTTGDTNGNGYWDFYTTDTGLVATDEVLSIKIPAGDDTWVDGVCYSDRDGETTTAFEGNYNTALSSTAWTGAVADGTGGTGDDATVQAACINISTITATTTTGRDINSTDTDSYTDFAITPSSTPGYANYPNLDSMQPAAISNLTGLTGLLEGSIILNWTAPGDDGTVGNLTGTFRINYSSVGIVTSANFTNTSSTFATVVDISTTSLTPLTACTTTFYNLTPGTSYWFAIKAQDDNNNWSVWNSSADVPTVNTSAYASAQDLIPSQPQGLSVLAGDTEIQLWWTANTELDISSYTIYCDSQPPDTVSWFVIGTTPTASTISSPYIHTGLQNGATYYYKITAGDYTGHVSVYSTTISTVPHTIPPHIVISQFTTKGANGSTDEFVEIYNSSAAAVSISSWVVQYSADGIDWTTNVSTVPAGITLSTGSYYLFASTGFAASVVKNCTYYFDTADTGGHWRLLDSSGNEIDRVGWGTASAPELSATAVQATASGSLERKPGNPSGNNYDTNNNATDFYNRTRRIPRNTNSPVEPDTNWPSPLAALTERVKSYFNTPTYTAIGPTNSEAKQSLLNLINSAQSYIYVAIYQQDDTEIATALKNRAAAGITVRVVAGNAAISFAQTNFAGSKVKWRPYEFSYLMHSKFVVVDGRIVWTGSGNFDSVQPPTYRALTSQNNDFMVVQSTTLAKNYEAEFKQMWWGYFGAYKQTSPTTNLTIAGTSIQNYYSPQNNPVNTTLRSLVQNAQESIFFAVYSFSVGTLLDNDVQTAFNNGRAVQGIIDDTQSDTLYNDFNTAGITIRYLSGPGSEVQLHNKLMVIDQQKVVTGSTNLSNNASSSNDENMVIIDDARLARQYVKYFKRVYTLGIGENNPPADVTAPLSVTGSSATPSGPGSISVNWNTYSGGTGDSGFSKYYVFISSTEPFGNTTYFANATDDDGNGYVDEGQGGGIDGKIIPEAAINNITLTGTQLTTCGGAQLIDGNSYWIAITAADKWGNESTLASGSVFGPVTSGGADITPPAQILDLVAYTGSTLGTILLEWTCTGDDGSFGLASAYNIRYSINPIMTESDFINATAVAFPPTPLFSGQKQTFEVAGLNNGTQYYFVLKVRDDVNNWSSRSNLAVAETQPDTTPADHIVISRLAVNSTPGESVELFNPTDSSIDISNWVVQYQTGGGGSWSNKITIPAGTSINSKRYYLIAAADTIEGVAVDIKTATSLGFSDSSGHVRITDNLSIEIDKIGYGSAVDPEGAAVSAPGSGNCLVREPDDTINGNSQDTDNNFNDFTVKSAGDRSPRNSTYSGIDNIPPSAITNLSALTGINPGEIIVRWTAPGDDDTTGNNISPAYYDLRYSTYIVTGSSEVWWAQATLYPSTISVANQGVSEQQILVLSPGVTFYFGIRTIDDMGNVSDLDNGTTAYSQAFAKASTGTIGGQIVINEVAPSQYSSDGDDWIEFYNPGPTTPDIYGWKIYEIYDSTSTPFEKFEGNWNFPVGSYLVLRFNRTRNMSNPVQINENSYEIATDCPGLTGPGTGTSGSSGIILQNNSGTWIDALFYSNCNEDISDKFDDAYDFAIANNNQWYAVVDGDIDAVNYRYYARNYSLSRDEKSTDGTSPSSAEWHVSAAPTPGDPTRGTQNWVPDTVVPAQITNLVCTVGENRGTIKLQWTAVAEDGTANTASGYMVRYSLNPINNDYDWDNATNYESASRDNISNDIVWPPGSPGTNESYTVGTLLPGAVCYIAIKTEDEQGNSSLISNVVSSSASAIVGSNIRINEVAPLQSNGQDWIEFYNATNQSININNWSVVAIKAGDYRESTIKETIPNITIGAGEYLVLNLNITAADETSDKGENGWWDVYASVDLRGFEGVVALRDNGGTIVDFVAYSGGDAVDWSRIWATEAGYLGAVQYHQWSPAGGLVSDAFNWSSGAHGVSFGRNIDSVDSDDVTGTSRNDWKTFLNPTKGRANDDISPDAITNLAAQPGTTDGAVKLAWTTTNDDNGYYGVLNGSYTIQYSSYTPVVWSTANAQVNISTSGIVPNTYVNYVVAGLVPASTYYFRIWAIDEVSNYSAISNAATGYAQDLNPDVATNFTIYRSSISKVDIRWEPPSPDPGDISYYALYSTTTGGAVADPNLITNVLYPGTSHQLSVSENATYYFYISVYDTDPSVLNSALLGPTTSPPTLTAPAPPQNFTGVALSTTSIQWSWQDVSIGETGFRIYNSTGGLSGTVGAGITSWTQTSGLLINTTYSAYVKSYNAVGESSASNTATKSTLANPPTTISFTNITHNEITFTFLPNNNPEGTRYGISRSTDNFVVSITTFITYTDNFVANTADVTGLLPSTSYWFRIWAYNQDGLATDYVTSDATRTITGAEHIVISQFAFEGPDSGSDEFVELYNPTNEDMNISGWKLQYNSGTGYYTRATVPSGKIIESNGFYLFAHSDFKWKIVPDAEFTSGANDTGATWQITDSAEITIDRVSFGVIASSDTELYEGTPISSFSVTDIPALGSFYRKPGSPNGAIVDTDNNSVDFSSQSVRRPHSSQSPKEPDYNWPGAAVPLSEDIKSYFTPATIAGTSQLKNELLNLINSAQEYIYVSIYTFINSDIINALNTKANLGVVVRLIVDPYTLSSNPTLPSQLSQNVKWCSAQIDSPIMHHKFIVVDGRSVETGSVNYTVDGLQPQDNDCVIIHSTNVAAVYQKEFEAMWWGYFKEYKKYYNYAGRVSSISTTVNLPDRTVPIDIRFSPDAQTANGLASLVGTAKESVFFDIFTFTDDTIEGAISGAKNRGLVVQGVFDRSQASMSGCPYGDWDLAGWNVRKDDNPTGAIMHSKLIVIDKDIIVSGSFNWTPRADTENDENQFIIYDRRLARQYIKYQKRIYELTTDENTAENPAPDTTSPSNIAVLSAAGSNSGAINVSWSSSTAADFSRYYVFVKAGSAITDADLQWDGTLIPEKVITNVAGTGCVLTTCQGTALVDGSNYYIAVLVMDKSGNESGLVQYGPVQTGIGADTTPPSTINDLVAAEGSSHGEVLLTWTATGDDWNTGIASKYDIRYSTVQEIVNDTQFNTATKLTDIPEPLPAGLTQTLTVRLPVDINYYFAMKVLDDAPPPNSSGLSNIAATQPKMDKVVINEFVYDPSGTDEGNEWLELYNLSASTINLAGWRIEKTNNTDWSAPKELLSIPSGTISPNGYFLLGQQDTIQYVTVDSTYSVSATMYNSATCGIRLKHSNGDVMDTVGYEGYESDPLAEGGSAAPESASGSSLTRSPDGIDTNNNYNDFVENLYPSPVNTNGLDTIPPSAINDLVAQTGTTIAGTVQLQWTAPGNDGASGNNTGGARYIVKYATYPVTSSVSTNAWWSNAVTYYQDWSVSNLGVTETKILNLNPGITYYFAIRTKDASGNISELDTKTVNKTQASATAKSGSVGSTLRINEIAPSQYSSDGNDWLEIYNPNSSGVNLQGLQFYESYYSSTTPFETFEGDWPLPGKYYLVLRFNQSTRNMTVPVLKGTSYYEVYTDKSGLTDSDDVIVIVSSAGTLLDAVCYSDTSGSISGSTDFRALYNAAVTAVEWTGPLATGSNDTDVMNNCANVKYITRNRSLSRDDNSTDGTNPAQSEWHISASPTPGSPTPGQKNRVPDTVPPAQVTTLSVSQGINRGSVKLTWTSVGDDNRSNTASGYVLKYSPTNITDISFDNVTDWNNTWTPSAPNKTEIKYVGKLTPGATYYFALKTEDEQPNLAIMSNVGFGAASSRVGSYIRINELAPLVGNGNDWVEIYNAYTSSVTLMNWKLYGLESGSDSPAVLKTFPNVWLPVGSYLVVNFSSSAAAVDETTIDSNNNGYLDVYGSYDLRGYEGILYLEDADGNMVDFVAYSQGQKADWDSLWADAVAFHQWYPATKTAAAAADWSAATATKSLGRDASPTDIDDTGYSRNDWYVYSYPTKGYKNDSAPPARTTDFVASGSNIEGYINLRWTAPGDDGMTGSLVNKGKYLVKYATYPVVSDNTWWDSIPSVDWDSSTNPQKGTRWLQVTKSPGSIETQAITGLYPDRTYYVALKTQDSTGNLSMVSSTSSAVAFNTNPSSPTWTSSPFTRTATSITTRWNPNPELDILNYEVQYAAHSGYTASPAWNPIGSTTTATSFTSNISAQPYWWYYYRLKARDKTTPTALESSWSSTLALSPDMTPPTITARTTPTTIRLLGDVLVIQLSVADNTGSQYDTGISTVNVRYRLADETTWRWATLVSGSYSVGAKTVSTLSFQTARITTTTAIEYYIEVKDVAGNGVIAGSGGDTTFLQYNTPTTISSTTAYNVDVNTEYETTPTATGGITVPDGNGLDGAVSVQFTDGNKTEIKIKQYNPNEIIVPWAKKEIEIAASWRAAGGKPVCVFEFTPSVVFKKPAMLSLLYFDVDNNGIVEKIDGTSTGLQESNLRLYYYDGLEWRYVGGKVNTTNNTITAAINHFTYYALFPVGILPEKPEAKEKFLTPDNIGPVGTETLNFQAQTEIKKIELYDITGKKIRTLNDVASWNGRDDDGNPVESGIYIYRVETVTGKVNTGAVVVAK